MLTIAWDIDDVLNDLMFEWLLYWKNQNDIENIDYEDLKVNPPHEILGISLDDYLTSLDRFRNSNLFLELKPNSKIKNWFFQYGHKAQHLALTSVPLNAAHQSAFWVLKNFGTWIRHFHFIPSARESDPDFEYHSSKKDFINWHNNIDILVEDNTKNYLDALHINIKAILISRPWNEGKLTLDENLDLITQLITVS